MFFIPGMFFIPAVRAREFLDAEQMDKQRFRIVVIGLIGVQVLVFRQDQLDPFRLVVFARQERP